MPVREGELAAAVDLQHVVIPAEPLDQLGQLLGLDDVLAVDAAQQRDALVQILERDRPQEIGLYAAAVWRARAARVFTSASAVGVRVVDAVAAADGGVLAVLAARARREVVRRGDFQLVATVGALVGAGGDVAAGRDGVRHGSS
jgi:hypothetical protein